MATRATITFHDDNDAAIATLYVHSDGYWGGAGQDLANILASRPLTDGIKGRPCFNGAANLAAVVIAELVIDVGKRQPGGYYLQAPGATAEGYHYDVRVGALAIELVAKIRGIERFRGTPAAFLACEEPSDDEDEDEDDA